METICSFFLWGMSLGGMAGIAVLVLGGIVYALGQVFTPSVPAPTTPAVESLSAYEQEILQDLTPKVRALRNMRITNKNAYLRVVREAYGKTEAGRKSLIELEKSPEFDGLIEGLRYRR